MIVVVGGGITGLAVGHALCRAGVECAVFESAARSGGVIRSATVEGRVLDWGPQRTRLTGPIGRLVRELGLADEVLTAPKGLALLIYRDGALHEVPFSARAFVRSGAVSTAGKLRMLLEPFTPGPDPDERVSTFFERKLGREVYETLVAPLYGGLYASDPADMEVGLSLIHVLREFRIGRSLLLPLLKRGGKIDPPPACSFRSGMQALPDALAGSLGGSLHLGHAVRAVVRAGAGWKVEVEGPGGSMQVDASAVVFAVPAPVAARLLRPVDPHAATVVEGLRYNPLGVVHLEAETDLRGLGFQVSFTERHRALRGVTFNDSLFGRKNVYTAYLGGALRPDIAGFSGEMLADLAVREFRDTTGFEARALASEHEHIPAWDVTWRGLSAVRVPDGIHLAGNWWSRPGIPGRLAEANRIAAVLTGGGAR